MQEDSAANRYFYFYPENLIRTNLYTIRKYELESTFVGFAFRAKSKAKNR